MKRTFKAALSLFRIRAVEGLQYRMATLSGATVGSFWALIEIAVLTVFYTYGGGGDSINGMSLPQAVSYIWIAQCLVIMSFSGVDGDLLRKINGGDIGVELCRPLDLYWHWFARTAAGKLNGFLLRGGAVALCGAVISLLGFRKIGLGLPASPLYFALFLLAVLGAYLFSTAFSMFVTAIRINVAWGDGPMHLVMTASGVLSGGYLPLQLWPDFMQAFLRMQPFASFLDTPARLYAGSADIRAGLLSMLFQAMWIAVFVTLGRVIMRRKITSIVVQGG